VQPPDERQRRLKAPVPFCREESKLQDERLVIWLAAVALLYSEAKLENGMLRAGTIIVLLGLAAIVAGCSKCASPFGTPGACHSGAPSTG
jgi:hypothetical protein